MAVFEQKLVNITFFVLFEFLVDLNINSSSRKLNWSVDNFGHDAGRKPKKSDCESYLGILGTELKAILFSLKLIDTIKKFHLIRLFRRLKKAG